MSQFKEFPSFLRGKESWKQNWQSSWTNNAIQTTASGRIRTLTTQMYPFWTIYLQYNHLTDKEADELQGFVNQCRGSNSFFWYKDYQRYRTEMQVLAKNPDGNTFQCVANIGGFIEPVFKVDNITVFINGIQTENYSEQDAVITIESTLQPDDVVTASYDFYFKCYFKDNGLTIYRNFINSNNVALNLAVAR